MDSKNGGMGGKRVLITGGTWGIGKAALEEIEAKGIAHDPAARRRLWEISEELTGLKVAA